MIYKNKTVLYITRNGLLEPLGQSQVLSYLRGLSKYYCITLISYEKKEDFFDKKRMSLMFEECKKFNINWCPKRFYNKPRLFAPALSILNIIFYGFFKIVSGQIKMIHARSYIPASIALILNKILGVPFIFDMRALWPEEHITAGRLKRGSFTHKIIILIERLCIKNASTVVSLTNAAVDYLQKQYPNETCNQKIKVIPTCADLNKFIPNPSEQKSSRTYACIGTILSGWFRADLLSKWFSVVSENDPDACFEIITRDDAIQVRDALCLDQEINIKTNIKSSQLDEMPNIINGHYVSIMFYAGGNVSELGRSPTRLAEVLGCGVPVVANEGVGDVADIVRNNNVGVIVEGESKGQMEKAFKNLKELTNDSDLKHRCRLTAQEIFSLKSGTNAYKEIYESILS